MPNIPFAKRKFYMTVCTGKWEFSAQSSHQYGLNPAQGLQINPPPSSAATGSVKRAILGTGRFTWVTTRRRREKQAKVISFYPHRASSAGIDICWYNWGSGTKPLCPMLLYTPEATLAKSCFKNKCPRLYFSSLFKKYFSKILNWSKCI